MPPPLTKAQKQQRLEELKQLAILRGGELLSTEYISSNTKMEWRCANDHIWWAHIGNIKNNNTWCKICGFSSPNRAKACLDDYKIIIESKGGELLSTEYQNQATKLLIKCEFGHIWTTTALLIKHGGGHNSGGSWCPQCNCYNKNTLETFKLIIESKGGELLSNEYIDKNTKLLIKCEFGHIWSTSAINLKSGGSKHDGSWCSVCNGKHKLNLDLMHEAAEKRGGKCLSKEYISIHEKLTWECSHGHIWQAEANKVINGGTWCSKCKQTAHETICREIFEELFNFSFSSIRPDWLRNPKTNCKLELDGYCSELNLAFEFNGPQHYKYHEHYHRSFDKFIGQQERDLVKINKCKENNTTLIIIKYSRKNMFDKEYFKNQILQLLEKENIHVK